ncbi:hypothetical protein MPTK1_3g16950 [Marchantia polymorpha subsp. ruderalis]|uniref:Secreted protein n=2 Tax=Marchantia polymorpha TaxID=3197 RepID=A0AAF6B1M8_MARPO|nr:hypothetical protein MARPO_0039s0100 [Marchantia polymorpha]BBN05912.1 hypothetical protein Mp_3g16950 [Marchantia polymorpha subsp. ruderalis]|eukprot:PTQ40613.1 hypothetical protein MARPO_0039s0100 [Marchantia polymorpha]
MTSMHRGLPALPACLLPLVVVSSQTWTTWSWNAFNVGLHRSLPFALANHSSLCGHTSLTGRPFAAGPIDRVSILSLFSPNGTAKEFMDSSFGHILLHSILLNSHRIFEDQSLNFLTEKGGRKFLVFPDFDDSRTTL